MMYSNPYTTSDDLAELVWRCSKMDCTLHYTLHYITHPFGWALLLLWNCCLRLRSVFVDAVINVWGRDISLCRCWRCWQHCDSSSVPPAKQHESCQWRAAEGHVNMRERQWERSTWRLSKWRATILVVCMMRPNGCLRKRRHWHQNSKHIWRCSRQF